MASLKTTSDLPGNSQSQSDQSPTVMNGSVVTPSVGAAGLLQNAQLTSELKHLMGTLLGGQGGSGVSLEQLLQSSTSSGHLSQVVKPAPASQQHQAPQATHTPPNPTTPSGAQGLWGSRKRSHASFDADDGSNPKRRRSTSYSARQSGEKQHNKGLRHFSQRVCEKVRQKGTTSYNEVADELVKELSETEKKTSGSSDGPIDHKNIRRRVYDALNVLMAMNIISKEKKEIKWIGLPTNSIQECQHIEAELAQTEERIQSKRTQVEDLLVQILTFKNLMKRNRERVESLGAPGHHHSSIGLPFIIVNTSKKTTIDCSISSDKSEYVFNFDNTFELHNDIDVLKKMGLDCGLHSGSCTADDLKQAKAMLPKAFESTLDEIALSKNFPIPGSLPHTPTTPIAVSSGLRPSPSLTSTPTTSGFLHASSRPSVHSPLVQGTSAASPLSSSQIAAALAQVRQANATLQAQQVGSVSPGVALDSPGRMSAPTTPKVSIPSPRAVTALVTNALRGAGAKTPVKPLNVSPSAVSSAKALLHSHSPSQSSFSPLVKATTSLATVSQGESPQLSKSPGPKIVTVSKLPASTGNAELNSLLQALQQNSNLLKQLPLVAGGISLANGSANGTGSGALVDGMSCTSSTASLPIQTGQTGQTSPLVHTTLLSNGLATTTM